MTAPLEHRVAWALRHYATANPALLADLVRDLWQELHAAQAAWGDQVARLDAVIAASEDWLHDSERLRKLTYKLFEEGAFAAVARSRRMGVQGPPPGTDAGYNAARPPEGGAGQRQRGFASSRALLEQR